jgi:hypothetical protein
MIVVVQHTAHFPEHDVVATDGADGLLPQFLDFFDPLVEIAAAENIAEDVADDFIQASHTPGRRNRIVLQHVVEILAKIILIPAILVARDVQRRDAAGAEGCQVGGRNRKFGTAIQSVDFLLAVGSLVIQTDIERHSRNRFGQQRSDRNGNYGIGGGSRSRTDGHVFWPDQEDDSRLR